VRPTSLLFFLIRRNNVEEDEQLISRLSTQFKDKKIFVACEQSRLHAIKKTKTVVALHKVEDLEAVFK
jgi:hypothetical protein